MTRIYKILRALVVTTLAVAVIVPVILYIIMSIGSVQQFIAKQGELELSKLLGTNVSIGELSISPFNKVVLENVAVEVAPGDTALKVERLGAGVMLAKLLFQQKLVFSYAEIIGLDASLNRDSLDAPLNIQPVIDRLSSNDKSKPSSQFDFRVNNIVIRKSRIKYDVLDKPELRDRFDKNHISINDLKADLLLPRVKNNDFVVELRRLAAREKSGFTIKSLSCIFLASDKRMKLSDFNFELPDSRLLIGDILISYDSWDDLTSRLTGLTTRLTVMPGTIVTPSDFKAFIPELGSIPQHIDIKGDIAGSIDDFRVESLVVRSTDGLLNFEMEGDVKGLPDVGILEADIPSLSIDIDGERAVGLITMFKEMSPKAVNGLSSLGRIRLSGALAGNTRHAVYNGIVLTSSGNVEMDVDYSGALESKHAHLTGNIAMEKLELGKILDNDDLGMMTAHIDVDADIVKSSLEGHVKAIVDEVDYKSYIYNNVEADVDIDSRALSGRIAFDDENLKLELEGNADLTPGKTEVELRASLRDFAPQELNLTEKYEGYRMSGDLSADLHGTSIEKMDGRIDLNRFAFKNEEEDGIELSHFTLMSSGSTSPQYVLIHSDIVDGQLKGHYNFSDILPFGKSLLSKVFPSLMPNGGDAKAGSQVDALCDFELSLDVKGNTTTNKWLSFFKSPVNLLQTVNVNISADSPNHLAKLDIEAPYLLQKDKFIENTSIHATVEGEEGSSSIYFATLYPTKKGVARIEMSSYGENDRLNTNLRWKIDRSRDFSGSIDLTTAFSRLQNSGIATDIDVHNSKIVLNDTAWVVHPSRISISDNRISVDNFDISRTGQFIKIAGDVSDSPADMLCLDLMDVNLDYVFETLDISNVAFGGVATGTFYASGLMSKEPHLSTPGLHVNRLSYNHSELGDAEIESHWDNEEKGVAINAVISQANGCTSRVNGAIYPLAEALDFRFKADKLNVGFMKPYMEAFTSEISGNVSGDARLYGTFKLIDMTGDIYAENLKLKLDFINAYYTTSDSIHLTPGKISFGDVVLKDAFGHTAKLDGWVTHKCFKEPEFEFNVTNARDFLCFDINDKLSPDWYGRIFCNGAAYIKGVPGFIDINVNMSTAPQSTFTFVLSDTEAADEYTFMTFHDRDELKGELLMSVEDPQQAAVKRLKEYYAKLHTEESAPSIYRINLQVDVTPDGELTLVMDPVGGDRIKARGDGNLRIEYNSADEDMKMFGTYVLSQGNYNFTLQDIIIKDFTIKPGSSISFHGDPLAATLNIQASYAVNANLSDLDESFLQDRELNRTNVPVHALLKVNGDMQQPDISFDLEFPTLTQDTYRKVKSIVSTDEMMNRQIIYLLALNRFYTPDYMGSTTKGNELVSVASSTISSQLGSMLGQISDNWNIAPNIRSDKGDFSDMEVDLALSSYLLNNRLLFNGNFGYRDNALNNNSFIGDFDLEYLLNKSGNIRLKAYNRYNDQNYYVKSALTTQGVGVMFKRDFDDIFSFIKRLKHKKSSEPLIEKAVTDTVKIKLNNENP